MVDNIQSPIFNTEQVVVEDMSFEDFLTQFADVHAEWVMGKVIVVTNNRQHQVILLFLSNLLNLYLGFKSLGRIYLAGMPMKVTGQPAREPDLIILLKDHLGQMHENYVDAPADIVVEIVSPESTIRDRVDKVREYAQAGVPEYWLIDSLLEQATIYRLGADGTYKAAPIDDGHLVSSVLADFRLNPTLLWQEEPPTGGELVGLVQRMITT